MSWLGDIEDAWKRSDAGKAAGAATTGGAAFAFLNPGTAATKRMFGANPNYKQAAGPSGGAAVQEERYSAHQMLIDKVGKASLDPQTKQKILAMQSLEAMQDEYQKAISGQGNYGPLKRNWDALMQSKDRPGGMQLFGNSQSRANAQGGMLSQQPTGLLTSSGGR